MTRKTQFDAGRGCAALIVVLASGRRALARARDHLERGLAAARPGETLLFGHGCAWTGKAGGPPFPRRGGPK